MPNTRPILFLKAAIRGGAAADLFSAPVMVQGHVSQDGSFIAPHASHRLKRRPEAAPPPAAHAPDLFSAPPPAVHVANPAESDGSLLRDAIAERDAKAEKMPPPGIMQRVQRMLAIRQDIADAIQNGRDTDAKFQGAGRYEAEVREKVADRIAASDDVIAKFRAIAEKNGVDADKVFAAAGGVADLSPVPASTTDPTPEPGDPGEIASAPPAPPAAEPYRPAQWGMAQGVKAKARIAANKAAQTILDSKPDAEMTEADRDVLARFTGWGGQGVGTSPDEYYTPRDVAEAAWALVRKLGFRGGAVLEPSAGTGVFQQAAPDDARIVAVELSDDSGRINRIMHGARDEVVSDSMEGFATYDPRQFDLIIGNPPYGARNAFRMMDLAKTDITRAEQYFLDTALDKAKDGGLVAFVLPSGVMDSSTARSFRERVLAKGQLLTAFRLPNTAFADSQTEVTTDLIVMRKRPQPLAAALGALSTSQQASLPHWNPDFVAGRYMTEGAGAAHIMGTLEPGWRAKAGIGDDITVSGSMDGVAADIRDHQPSEESLADDTPTLAAILDAAGEDRAAVIRASERTPYPERHAGDRLVKDGILYVLQGDPLRWHRAEEPVAPVVDDARAVAELLDTHLAGGAGDAALHRVKLLEALDAFVEKHGAPGQNRRLLDWTNAPQLPTGGADAGEHAAMTARAARQIAMLLGAVRTDGGYSDAITGHGGAQHAPLATLATEMAGREGSFTVQELAAAAGRDDPQAIEDEIFADPGFAKLPGAEGRWTSQDQYHAGERWPKYDAALAASQDASLTEAERQRMARQADDLLAAIAPMDLGDVQNIEIGSPFVTKECIAAWQNARRPNDAPWTVTDDRGVYSVRSRKQGHHGWPYPDDLLERVLMRRGVRKDEAPDVDRMQASFRDWLMADEEWRAKTEERYNRDFRGFAPRSYSQDAIPTPGLNPDFSVNAYHWAGVRRALDQGRDIIAADVGVGKTPRALILNQLLRSTGRAKKPAIVMPKSLIANWVAMQEKMFPGARVMTIGETIVKKPDGTITSKEDDEATRRRKLADITQNDYDFIFMTLPAWNRLNLEEERTEQWESEDFFAARREALEGMSDKGRAKAQARQEGKVAATKFLDGGERNITLEDTGIDAVTIDEGHSMKNLSSPEAGQFQGLKFLGAPGTPSKQATATYHKMRWIREKSGSNGNVFMLTATPTKNSPLEIYSMIRHIAPETWTNIGIRSADDFVARFVETDDEQILGTKGEIEDARVVVGFQNMDEMRSIARRWIDRTTASSVGLKLPTPETHQHLVDMDGTQTAAYEALRPRLEAALKTRDAEGSDHPFSVMSDMQKAATDMRLLEPHAGHGPSPKMQQIAANVLKLSKNGGQIVFSDYVDAHGMMRDQLVAMGMDPKRIGIINAAAVPSSTARQKVADAFNAGKLDVVIGNTATMGEGLNLQENTTDIHHADTPWEPASIRQRNGRGLRQGNTRDAVGLHTYLSKGSFDAYRWQTMMAKGDWQKAFWGGGDRLENLMKRGGTSRLEMMIACAADPEKAREAFAGQLEAAKDRRAASEQRQAHMMWADYRDAAHQLAAMTQKRELRATLRRAEATPEPSAAEASAAEAKLALRVARLKRDLSENKAFLHMDALDAKDVAIDYRSGRVWRPGDEIEVQPGGKFQTHSTDPEGFIVHAVDEAGGQVHLIPGAHAGEANPSRFVRKVDMAHLRDGVSATKVDREAAAARQQARLDAAVNAAAAAKRAAEEAAASETRRLTAQKAEGMLAGTAHGHAAELAPMGDAWMNEHRAAISARLRDSLLSYRSGHHGSTVITQAPDGTPHVVRTYQVKDMPKDHTIALPTSDLRDRLIGEEVAHRLTAPLRDSFTPVPRTRSGQTQYAGAKRDKPEGADILLDGSPHTEALRTLWPAEHSADIAEVARRADQHAAAAVRAAPSWKEALIHAAGGVHERDAWTQHRLELANMQPLTMAALHDAAVRHDVAGTSVDAGLPKAQGGSKREGTLSAMRRLIIGRDGNSWGTIGDRLKTAMTRAHPAHPETKRIAGGADPATPPQERAA